MSRLIIFLFFVAPFIALAGERALDDLLFDATRYANTPERRAAKESARAELIERMPDALRAAMRWVHGDRVMIQVLVMEWVQAQPAEVVTPVLLEFLRDEREDTRRIALFFLGFKDMPDHADHVLPHLENESTRGAALRTLGKWRCTAARAEAETWLAEGGERVRVVAANALRDIGDPAAIPALVRALEDPVFTVRNTAARAILVLAGDDASLLPALIEDHPMLRRIHIDASLMPPPEDIHVEDGFYR